MNKRSPFSADRNHLHHMLLDLGLSHLAATIVLITSNLVFFIVILSFQYLGINVLFILTAVIGLLASIGLDIAAGRLKLPYYLIIRKGKM